MKEILEKKEVKCKEFSFVDSNDISAVVQGAVKDSDVIYIPTDNTAASNTEVIDSIARPAGVPIIAGEEGICSGCGVATLSIKYYDLGYTTGEMAYDILVNDKDVAEMDVQFAPKTTKLYNKEICDELKITVPDSYEAIAE
jgi:putative ABC transport system substrate-binding protein